MRSSDDQSAYRHRVVAQELDELMTSLPAIVLEGPKGVGKTATASRRAATIRKLDDRAQRNIALADPQRLMAAPPPILIAEWQYEPNSWDRVRRAVGGGPPPGLFLLPGPPLPIGLGTHSGAGRI